MEEKITGNKSIRVNWHVYEDVPIFYRMTPTTGKVNIQRYNTLNADGEVLDFKVVLSNASVVRFMNTDFPKDRQNSKFYRIV